MREEQKRLLERYIKGIEITLSRPKDIIYFWLLIDVCVEFEGRPPKLYDIAAARTSPSPPAKAKENNGEAVRAGVRRLQRWLRENRHKRVGEILENQDIVDDDTLTFVEYLANRIIRGKEPGKIVNSGKMGKGKENPADK